MDNQTSQPADNTPSENAWARPVEKLKVSGAPQEALNINVDGRRLNSPIQGFGQMWQKTFKVCLPGVQLSPAEVMEIWKANFQRFQPPENTFYPTLAGIKPGEVLLIEGKVPPLPGLPPFLPVATGVLVMYADDSTFTVMTPEGHPEAGWNTFSVYEEEGVLIAQTQSLGRTADPLYEFFNRFMGSSGTQDQIWTHVLYKLSEYFGVKGQVMASKILVDPKVQWSQTRNIWKNAGVRTVFYILGAPIRWIRGLFKKR